MDAEQLKNNLVMYAEYKCTNIQELKIIENSVLNSVSSYFRPVVKDVHGISSASKNINKNLRKEETLKKLKEMKQVSDSFIIDELVVSLASKAHNEWILEHKLELENANIKNPEKFVPFELLTTKELNDYLRIIKPIFNCLNIKIDEQEVRKAFARRQLVFMIKNEIYSGENLKEKIMKLKQINPEIIESSIDGKKTMQDLYAQEEIAETIAEHVKHRVNLNIADRFKEVLSQNNSTGFFMTEKGQKRKLIYRFSDSISQKKIGFKKQGLPKCERPIKKVIYQLAKFGGVIIAKNVKTCDYKYYDYSNISSQFIEKDECNEEQKRAIDRRERKLKKFLNNIDYNKDADTPGIISLVVVKENPMSLYENVIDLNSDDYQRKKEVIQIPITQRELAKMKILPEEVGWEKEKKAKINSSDKVIFVVPNKTSPKKSEFKDLLRELAKNANSSEERISMESLKNVYKANKEKDENQR